MSNNSKLPINPSKSAVLFTQSAQQSDPANCSKQSNSQLSSDEIIFKLHKLPIDKYLQSLEEQIDSLQEIFLTKLFRLLDERKINLDEKITICLEADGSIEIIGAKDIYEIFNTNQYLCSSLREIAIKALIFRALEDCNKAKNIEENRFVNSEKLFQLNLKGRLAHSFLL